MQHVSLSQLSFEIPLYKYPSGHFRDFVEKFTESVMPCFAKYENDKLTFKTTSMKASVTPVSRSFHKSENYPTIKKMISIFGSKFNASASVAEKGQMRMEILDSKAVEDSEKMYGDAVECILRCTVACTNPDAQRFLVNFFELLDTYGN